MPVLIEIRANIEWQIFGFEIIIVVCNLSKLSCNMYPTMQFEMCNIVGLCPHADRLNSSRVV